MDFAVWSLLVGLLLVLMALGGTVLARLPLSTAMLYLAVGVGVGPIGLGLLWVDPAEHAHLLERLTEVVVLVSLFTAGLKLSPGLGDRRWLLPLRLATASMVLTVLAITAIGTLLLGLPLGAAVLLGGILAPTDPVLASDVQVHDPQDRDKLRFSLGDIRDGSSLTRSVGRPDVLFHFAALKHIEVVEDNPVFEPWMFDNDPTNDTDCKTASDRGTIVHASELQVFTTETRTPGGPGTTPTQDPEGS